MKIRIFTLAKELNIDSKVLIQHCNQLGFNVKESPLVSISEEERDLVLSHLRSPDEFLAFLLTERDGARMTTTINLSRHELSKLPASIVCFSNLKKIVLSHNRFDAFPEELLSLPALSEIDISHNSLSSLAFVPAAFNSLTALDISHNSLTTIPVVLFDAPALKILKLANNTISVEVDPFV